MESAKTRFDYHEFEKIFSDTGSAHLPESVLRMTIEGYAMEHSPEEIAADITRELALLGIGFPEADLLCFVEEKKAELKREVLAAVVAVALFEQGLNGTARTLSCFWYFEPVMELWNSFLNLDVDIHTFTATEGNRRLVLHLQRERNPTLVRKKKKQASSLDCEVCGFSFGRAYGSAGTDYCEVHHLIPLSEVEHTTQTRLEDLAILCANCHRVAHLRNPPYTLEEVQNMLALSGR